MNVLQAGSLLHERYEVQQLIGQGGMGAVYEAVDTVFGSRVAIKQQRALVGGSPQDVQMVEQAFQREAKFLHLLRHPSLPRVTDFFRTTTGLYLVMDYIEGADLWQQLQQRLHQQKGPFSYDEVARWADKILDALDYLHTQPTPIIHRDIKPHNIKVSPRGEVMLLDFGLAKGDTARNPMIAVSIYAYTLPYAPLEQIQGTGTEQRSDLYALGATMYHLLTGESPGDLHPRGDAQSRAAALINGGTDPLVAPAHVPEPVRQVLMHSLALRIEERPASAAAMQRRLHEAMLKVSGQGVGGEVVSSSTPAHTPTPTYAPTPTHAPTPSSNHTLPRNTSPKTMREVKQISFSSAVLSTTITPDGQHIVTGTSDGLIRLIRLSDGRIQRTMQGHSKQVRRVVCSTDGVIVASAGEDCTARLWRLSDGKMLRTIGELGGDVRGIALVPDRTSVITATWGGEVRQWRVRDGALQRVFRSHMHDAWGAAASPDGRLVAVGGSDSLVWVWRLRDAMLERCLSGHRNWVMDVAFSPDGSLIASGSLDHTVRVWRVADGVELHTLKGPNGYIASLTFSPDGTLLASGSSNGTIRLWNTHDGSLVHDLSGHTDVVTGLAYAADGQTLVSSSTDQTVRVWRR
jgi:WD40 repeat protein/tRNA A-37 threonylcarbamoyl transferase component Bud32